MAHSFLNPNATTKEEYIYQIEKDDLDIQGVDWTCFGGRTRDYFRHLVDEKKTNYFNVLPKRPKYEIQDAQISTCLKKKRFIPNSNIKKTHFQLHSVLLALSPRDLVYTIDGKIEMMNTESLEKTVLAEVEPTVMAKHQDLVAFAHLNSVSIVSANDPKMIIKTFTMEIDQALLNCVKFFENPKSGLQLIVAGNGKWMRIFDIDGGDTPVREISVETFVNHFSIDKNREKIAVCYDAQEIDVFDFRSEKKIMQLIGHKDFSFSSDFHDNGYILATGNQDLTTRIWDLRKPESSLEVIPASRNNVGQVKFLKNSSILAIGESMNYFNLYHTGNYNVKEEIDYFGQFIGFDYVGDGHDTLFIGFQHYYADISGGILEVEIGDV